MAQIWRVRATGDGGSGGTAYFTAYYQSGANTPVQARNSVGNFFNETKALWQGSWTIQGDVALVDTLSNEIIQVAPGITEIIGGTKSGEILPRQTQMLLQYRTGEYVNGREVRGRSFLPGFTEDQSNSGVPDANLRSNIQAAALAYLSGANDGTEQVIYSRGKAAVKVVTAWQVWSQWAVLRSRR